MSTPADPMATPGQPQVPNPVPQAASGDASDRQIAELAAQLAKPQSDPTKGSYRKGNITAIDTGDANSPPTVTVLLSGDTTTPIEGVRFNSDYSPQIGDMVILAWQGSEFFCLCSIAPAGSVVANSTTGGWTKATLNGAHSHNGNSNGDVCYRRIMEDGSWKMQWKGAINYGGTTTVLASALTSDFRPASKRSKITSRDVNNGGGVSIGLDFNTDGTVTVVAPTWSTNSDGHNHSTTIGISISGSTGGHSHSSSLGDAIGSSSEGISGSGSGSGTSTTDTHSHTASNPTWIGFDLEYFL